MMCRGAAEHTGLVGKCEEGETTMLGEFDATQFGRGALDLDGWADRSSWPWDRQAGSLSDQLSHDRADDDDEGDDSPELRITPPFCEATDEPTVLARLSHSRDAVRRSEDNAIVASSLARTATPAGLP
jgi:hypothetical protein